MSDVIERLMRYCAVPSQSDPEHFGEVPSTPTQHDIATVLADELRELGAEQVEIDEHAYVTASWPASAGAEDAPALAFCCHHDTAPQTWGSPVHPVIRRVENGAVHIGRGRDGRDVVIDASTNPCLATMEGEELVVTDGTSLLGGDDKAGIAAVMALLARLAHDPSLSHPRLAIAFVPDEEIGHGAALLDIEKLGAPFGYTIDAGPLGEMCFETFNAAEARIEAHGLSVHTGTAKGVMKNACEALCRLHQLLPPAERPEFTEGRDGFFYLCGMEGNCEQGVSTYIIRDHDQEQVERRKCVLLSAAAHVNAEMGAEVLTVEIRDQYRNLADVVCQPEYAHLITNARAAYAAKGITSTSIPMRGGTDGSQLSFRGLPCVNLSACYYNAHGVREFVPVRELEAMVDVLQELVATYAHTKASAPVVFEERSGF